MNKIVYKLTDQKMQTHNDFQWELNKWYQTSGQGDLCSSEWLHFYSDPLLAILFNLIHAQIENPRLFIAEVKGKSLNDRNIKMGWNNAKLIKELPLPNISLTQKIIFGILCSLKVYKEKSYVKWAKEYINNIDRAYAAAHAAAAAAHVAHAAYAHVAHAAAAADAADAAYAAAHVAYAAYAAAHAAYAAHAAAHVAAHAAAAAAADAANVADKKINFSLIAKKALAYK